MQKKALFTVMVFIVALFAGQAFAADQQRSGTNTGTIDRQQQNQMQSSKQHENTLQQAGMHKVSDLMGQKVVDQNGQELGSVDNMIVGNNGQVQYIILSRGGVLGVGGTLVPVPWDAANLRTQGDQLVASISKQKLDSAPTFSGDNWAQISQPGYEQQLNSYYGSQQQQGQQQERQNQYQNNMKNKPNSNMNNNSSRQSGVAPDANPNAATSPGTATPPHE